MLTELVSSIFSDILPEIDKKLVLKFERILSDNTNNI